MNRSALVGLIVLVVAVAGIFFFNKNADAPQTEVVNNNQTVEQTPNPTETQSTVPEPTPTPEPVVDAPKTYEISMTDSGYTPSQLTVKKGDTVKFINNGTKANWPASAPHPTHTDYSAFDPKKGIAVGESWSFTFDQVGRWPFHDHLNPTRFGAITVTE